MRIKSLRALKNTQGMTLLEIMIVLAILGSLIGILAGNVMSRLKAAKVKEARIQISEVGKALDMFYTDCGFYPGSDAGLDALTNAPSNCSNWGPDPYVKKVPKDPWGRDFIYESQGGTYVLMSLGEDGREGGEGTNKDISSDNLDEQ